MALPIKKASAAESLAAISNVLLSAFIIAALFLGRDLLVPFALAALLTFMLAPLVTRLQRWLGRVCAVLLVVLMMFATAGGAAWVLTRQAVDVANKLPDYKENIRTKLRSIRLPSGGPFKRISQTLDELKKDLPGQNQENTALKPNASQNLATQATPVEVVNGKDQRLEFLQVILAPVLGPLGTASLVLLLLVFMLLQRDDLRNRLIRLIGQGRISTTSRAMDEAGSRVSKYLRMQLVVNLTYGIAVAIGLSLIGLPNAILWGALATVLRFIPYVGPWIAAMIPVLLSFAISPGWSTPALTIGLYIVIELISNNVMEPWLYGSSTGVTPIALIVAAMVWTWLWGPVGLILATPITVCLVVMGRHIPRLAFLSIVLSDEEALTQAEDFYHRLHRAGEHDAMEFVETFLKSNPLSALFDTVFIPVITAAWTDQRLGLLDIEQIESLERELRETLDDVEIRMESVAAESPIADAPVLNVCCLPARAYRDELAGTMMGQLLRQQGCNALCASSKMLASEVIDWVRNTKADVVCISAVAPTKIVQARFLSSKLRRNFPEIKIIVGLWGSAVQSVEETKSLEDSGANEIVNSLAGAVEAAVRQMPFLATNRAETMQGGAVQFA
jgi:predicted PurR-regulated permease PerM